MPQVVRSSRIAPSRTGFVGRRRELALLGRLASRPGLVTLRGPGGIGKTRLAGEFLRAYVAGAREVYLVDLGPLSRPELVASWVASTIGLNATGAEPLDLVCHHLADRDAIVVLDTCEHLTEAIRRFVTDVVSRCPEITLIATSRHELGVPGEQILAIPPLSVSGQGPRGTWSDSAELFLLRARLVDPDFGHGPRMARTIHEICQRLDGIPLAIELAAARTRALSVEQIRDHLGAPLDLLSDGSPALPDRQRSLRASLQWSFELCSPEEQKLWTELSYFAGSFDLDAVEAIRASGDGERRSGTLPLIQSLTEKSIVTTTAVPGRMRYRLLDSIRAFGRERLAVSSDETRLAPAHVRWYARVAAALDLEWVGPRQADRLAWAVADLPNIRLAIETALAEPDLRALVYELAVMPTAQLWWTAGNVDEGRYWLSRVLDAFPEPGEIRARALRNDATLALAKGDAATAATLAAEQAEMQELLPAQARRPEAAAFISAFHLTMTGRFAEAVAVATGGLAEIAEEPVRPVHLQLRQVLVYALAGLGDDDRGRASCQEILAISQEAGEEYYAGFALQMLALYALATQNISVAQDLVDRAMRISSAYPNRPENPDALMVAALVAAALGQPDRAHTLLGAAEATAQTFVALTRTFLEGHPGAVWLQELHAALRRGANSPAWRRGASLSPTSAITTALHGGGQEASTDRQAPPSGVRLTARESQVASLVAQGMTDRLIAEKLGMSVRTAEVHVARILGKIGGRSREQIGRWLDAYGS